MVTQCTACQVWFKVTREQLHAAHGLVRCSACNTVFNALATLRHDMPEGGVLAGTTSAVREQAEVDFEEAASREPEAPEPESEEDAEPDAEPSWSMAEEENAARAEPQAADGGESRETKPYLGMPTDEAEPGPEYGAEFEPDILQDSESPPSAPESLDELDLYMASALDDESTGQHAAEAQGRIPETGPNDGLPPSLEDAVDSWLEAAGSEVEREAAEASAHQETAEASWAGEPLPALPAPDVVRGKVWQRRLWRLVVGLASLVLVAQIVYSQRDALGRIFGLPRSEPMLQQYAISRAELDAAQQPGALILKGALVNQGPRTQPLPMIRVTLTNRYGDTVGARILSPRQYGASQKTLLQAHQRFMFHVKLADPGSSAVGFSLVLCKHRGHSIMCQDS